MARGSLSFGSRTPQPAGITTARPTPPPAAARALASRPITTTAATVATIASTVSHGCEVAFQSSSARPAPIQAPASTRGVMPSTVASTNTLARTPNAASSRLVAANGITGDRRSSAITCTARAVPAPSRIRCTASPRGESASARSARSPTSGVHSRKPTAAASSAARNANSDPSALPNRKPATIDVTCVGSRHAPAAVAPASRKASAEPNPVRNHGRQVSTVAATRTEPSRGPTSASANQGAAGPSSRSVRRMRANRLGVGSSAMGMDHQGRPSWRRRQGWVRASWGREETRDRLGDQTGPWAAEVGGAGRVARRW
jgi:hypothetical protein